MTKTFRRKSRQIKMTVNIPEEYDTEEAFMESLKKKMDDGGWMINLDEDAEGIVTLVPVSKMQLGEIEIER